MIYVHFHKEKVCVEICFCFKSHNHYHTSLVVTLPCLGVNTLSKLTIKLKGGLERQSICVLMKKRMDFVVSHQCLPPSAPGHQMTVCIFPTFRVYSLTLWRSWRPIQTLYSAQIYNLWVGFSLSHQVCKWISMVQKLNELKIRFYQYKWWQRTR